MLRNRFTWIAALLLLAAVPAAAQILWVTGTYRVVSVDPNRHRIGIQILEADPGVRQNWCYLDLDSKMIHRVTDGEGWQRDEELWAQQILKTLKPGDEVRIRGGRDWDMSIKAKMMWFPARSFQEAETREP